jgi:hypothetical protein
MLADGASEAPSVRWHALKYSEFVREIGVTLYPAQQALTLVAFDGLEPCELPPELREYALAIFGPVDYLPASARRVLTAVCGGRGGKSYTLGALRLLHLSLTVPLDVLAPGEQAAAITIAPELDLAKQVLSYVGGALLSHPELIACIASKHQIQSLKEGHKLESITIRRPHDSRLVEIQCRAASRGGLGGRGRTLVGAHLDECAFFRDKDSGVVNDSEVFKAIVPRIVEGGQAVLTSTPYAESGVLYEEFKANHPTPGVACSDESPGRPHRAIAAHAPSILLRPDPIVYAALAAEEARDPLNASREFGARFLTAGESAYFDSAACSRIVEVAPCPARSFRTLGCDLAHVRSSSRRVVPSGIPTCSLPWSRPRSAGALSKSWATSTTPSRRARRARMPASCLSTGQRERRARPRRTTPRAGRCMRLALTSGGTRTFGPNYVRRGASLSVAEDSRSQARLRPRARTGTLEARSCLACGTRAVCRYPSRLPRLPPRRMHGSAECSNARTGIQTTTVRVGSALSEVDPTRRQLES